MGEQEQVRPLAPATVVPSSDDGEAATHLKKIRRRKCLKCCGIVTALLLIIATAIVVLIFTVFRVRDPIIRTNGFTVIHLELVNGTTPKPGSNISIIADVSVKNPNFASFKYSNTTTALYYHGAVVGEARGPPGSARARRTMRMNVTVDIIADRLTSNPSLSSEIGTGVLAMDSYSKIPGRVKLVGIFKRHITVKMNCSIAVNITGQQIQNTKCKRKIDL